MATDPKSEASAAATAAPPKPAAPTAAPAASPEATPLAAPADEPRFALGRLLDLTEGEKITGLPYPVIVGALADADPGSELTRADVEARAQAFLNRTVEG
jgi:hypothetical protein